MQKFLEYVLFNEGVNPQLAVVQLSKKWRLMDRVPEKEIEARISNTSRDSKMNIDAIVKMLSDADPTTNKEFFAWILSQYVNEKVRLPEDNQIIQQDLTFYNTIKKNGVLKRFSSQIKQQLEMNNKQNPMDLTTIDRFGLQSLVDKVKEITGGDAISNRQKSQIVKQEGATSIWKNEEWEIVQVESGDAACYYAKGTRWCTSNDRTADYYIRQGPLYIVFQDGKPFCQIHFPSDQAMDPQDRPIKNIPDEIIEAFLSHVELDEDEKHFLYSRADKNGNFYDDYIKSLEKKFDAEKKNYKFRNEIYVDVDFHNHDDYVYISGGITFEFPLNLFIKNPQNLSSDYALMRTITNNVDISTQDYPEFYVRNDIVDISFNIEENEQGRTDLERWENFLKTIDKGYNDDDDYKKIKNKIYKILVQNNVMKKKTKEFEDELEDENHNDNFRWFKLDSASFDYYGNIEYETDFLPFLSTSSLGVKNLKSGEGFGSFYIVDKMDTKPLADAIEEFLIRKNISKLNHHRSQGVLPGFHKPRIPNDFFNTRRAPKVTVKLKSKKDDINIYVRIEANVHTHNERILNILREKVKYLDKHFMDAIDAARKVFVKMLPDIMSSVSQNSQRNS